MIPSVEFVAAVALQKQIFKKSWEHAKGLCTCLVAPLGKIYGRVAREKLCGVLWEYGVDGSLLLAVK